MNPQPSNEDKARQRFLILSLIRLSGVVLAIFGIAIVAGKVDLPLAAGYVLIAAGAIDSLVLPAVLMKAWATPRQ